MMMMIMMMIWVFKCNLTFLSLFSRWLGLPKALLLGMCALYFLGVFESVFIAVFYSRANAVNLKELIPIWAKDDLNWYKQ